jgi:transcriptional regulator with XRE-family HTH domain
MSDTAILDPQAVIAARKRKRWSQFRFAVAADVHPNTVSIFERTGHCTQRTAERLAAALGVSVAALRGEEV